MPRVEMCGELYSSNVSFREACVTPLSGGTARNRLNRVTPSFAPGTH